MFTDHALPDDHERSVTAHLEAVVDAESDLALAVAVADHHVRVDEELTVTLDGRPVEQFEVLTAHHGRLNLVKGVGRGHLVIDYRATVVGAVAAEPPTDLEVFQYVRPSRYCESDRIAPLARAEFAGLHGADLLAGVSSWVGANIAYVPGSSRPIDGAVATLLAREGVCRDFAHLTAALLRANDVPARVVSVYAPGLDPMDFHAVAEACIDGAWCVVDPTCLAPRDTMVRISTGVDASDIAFMTNLRGLVDLTWLSVGAVATSLPFDDITRLTTLQ
jgi:hypothetical protein